MVNQRFIKAILKFKFLLLITEFATKKIFYWLTKCDKNNVYRIYRTNIMNRIFCSSDEVH